ncbi:MAG: hypothetical protein AAF734_01420 [Bacteroidota bacterium]
MKNIRYILFLGLFCLCLGSCEQKEFDYVVPNPEISFLNSAATRTGVPGGTVRVRFTAQAVSELSSVVVTEQINGESINELETITDFNNPIQSEITFTYLISTTAQSGDVIVLNFAIADQNGDNTQNNAFTINIVDALFLLDTIDINGEEVIEISAPAEATSAIINDESFVFATGNKYLLTGEVRVEEDISITAEPGTEIYANTTVPALAVLRVPQGAQMDAQGTQENPIVMTSDKVLRGETPAAGDWQGLRVDGDASNAESNSGIYRYIRVEYAGQEGDDTTASFLFTDVGTGTTIEFLQGYESAGFAFRFDGGTARARYLVGTNAAESVFRFDDEDDVPFQGELQFLVAQVNIPREEEMIEVREAFPTLANVTILGRADFATVAGDEDALRIREGSLGYRIVNMSVSQIADDAARVQLPDPSDLNGNKFIAHSYFFDIEDDVFRDEGGDLANPEYNNTVGTAINGITGIEFAPTSEVTSTYNPQTLSSWFMEATFVGAIQDAASDWTANGEWCRNSDGTIR